MKEGTASNLNYNVLYCLYLPTALYYSLILVNDSLSNLILLLTLLSVTSLFSSRYHKINHFCVAFVAVLDIIVKVLLTTKIIPPIAIIELDLSLVTKMLNFFSQNQYHSEILVYLSTIILSILTAWSFNISSKIKSQLYQQLKFLEFLSTTLDFITPILLYILCFMKVTNNNSFRSWLQKLSPQISGIELGQFQMFEQVVWGLITAVYLVSKNQNIYVRRFITLGSILLIIRDHSLEFTNPQILLYQIKWNYISIIKLSLLLCFRILNKTALYSQVILSKEQNGSQSAQQSRMSSHMRYAYRRKINQLNQMNHILVFGLILLTIVVMVLTNAISNVLVIIGIALNFPQYVQTKFRKFLGIGITIGLLLQPEQFIYFLLLYIVRFIRTQDHTFSYRNWWIIIQITRVVVLFSKVSLFTFLIGLFQNQWLVVLTLIFRTVCSYYRIIIVFMGTVDNYLYYVQKIVPKSIYIDSILWFYLLLLKIYSATSSIKFASTDITNIFQEYPIINYIQKSLKILKIFHWIAYAAISLFILNSQPSFFTIMRIIPLVVVFTVGILQSHKSSLSYKLWLWNFYTSLIIAFVKYFYLLSKYDNLSSWLIRILKPLIQHHKFIGLTAPDNSSLWVLFGADFVLILVNAVVLYVIKVQISELNYIQTRNRIYQEQHLQDKLLEKQQPDDGQKNIHYLYKNYIKPIDLKFKEQSRLRIWLTDFILDMAFFSFIIVFYFFKTEQIQLNYIPHFLLFLFAFCKQKGKHQYTHFFKLLVAFSSLDLLFIYVKYFYSLIEGAEIDYDIPKVISKYFLLIISVFFNSINIALSEFYNESPILKNPEHSFLLFGFLAPIIPNYELKKEVISLYMQIFKMLSLAFFLSVLISGSLILKYIHFIHLVIFIVLIVIFSSTKMQFFKRYWMYILLSCTFVDLFFGFYLALLGLTFLRGHFMLLEEFDLHIFIQRYDRTNKTMNQEVMKKIEQEQSKLQKKFQNLSKNRLDVISEVRQIRENEISEKIEDVAWKQKHIYVTIVWLLPIIFIFLIQFGVIFYSNGYFALAIFALNFAGSALALKKLFQFNITNTFVKWLTILGTITFILSLLFYLFVNNNSIALLEGSGFGIFFTVVGTLGYYQLLFYNNHPTANQNHKYSYHITFCEMRSLEAIQYWKKKCEMVSQLGSQIHNQKKMVSLRKYFLNRVNLSIKVEQLEHQLKSKSAHRKSRFQSFHILEREQERQQQIFKKDEFQVYSNMLTFMSFEDLQLCYLSLNQYYRGEVGNHIDLAQVNHQMRQWILDNFEQSFHQTLKKHRRMYLNAHSQCLQSQENSKVVAMFSVDEHPQKEQQQQELPPKIQQNPVLYTQIDNTKKIVEQKLDPVIDSPIKLITQDFECYSSPGTRPTEQFGQRIDMRLNQLCWPLRKIVQNIEIIGLIITAGWNFYGGVYTIPTNIAIFSWAIVLQTKTTVVFWFFLMTYSFSILACKLILSYLPQYSFINFLFYYHSNDYFYEFLIIFVSAIQIIFLKMGGTSEIAYSQRQNIFDAFYRNILNQAVRGRTKNCQEKFLEIYKKMRNANKHSFFYRVFSKGRLKPGKDLYPLLAIIQVIILFYIFFFYDLMQFQSKNNRKSLGQILTVTQFSKNMIVALFFQVLIMIADRIIVALNLIDRLNQKIQNFFFNIAFKNDSKYTDLEAQELDKLGKFDYLLVIKYIFHVILLVLINFFVYFYIPSGGMQKNLIPQCQNAVCGKSYNYLSLFLLLYLIYFVISGLQIKHGFNRNKCRNTLMQRFHWIDYYIYMFFTGIPFLWQFKKISDWTITATSLPLFHYMKFQDINARMYQSKCEAQILKIKELGKGPWYKFLMGPPGFLFLLILVFSPIVMYSSLNPFAVKDQILAASSRLQLVMNGNNHYNFFKTSHTNILPENQLSNKHKILGLFDRAELYKLDTSSYPDQDFSLSQPAALQLAQNLRKTSLNLSNFIFQFRLIVQVSQKVGGDSSFTWGSKQLQKIQIEQLYKTVTSQTNKIQISNFFSPLPGEIDNQSIILYNRNQGQYYELYTPKIQPKTQTKGDSLKGIFVFYKSSVKYKVAFGLLTFYLTYVVLINSLSRFYLTGGLQIILFQGPQLQKILFLCEAVRSARILQNFYQEQYLYFSLMDLMRYPRMIKNIADDFSNLRQPLKLKNE